MIRKYWDLKDVSFTNTQIEEGDLIAYGATQPDDPTGPQVC